MLPSKLGWASEWQRSSGFTSSCYPDWEGVSGLYGGQQVNTDSSAPPPAPPQRQLPWKSLPVLFTSASEALTVFPPYDTALDLEPTAFSHRRQWRNFSFIPIHTLCLLNQLSLYASVSRYCEARRHTGIQVDNKREKVVFKWLGRPQKESCLRKSYHLPLTRSMCMLK